ncbi:hypothetical protein [Leptospira perolatii]|nr:hypothetical protein [Leptospira perolatii]
MKKKLAFLTILSAISFGCDDGKKNDTDALLTVLLRNRPVPVVISRAGASMNSATTILVSVYSGQNCTGSLILNSSPLTGVSQASTEVPSGTTFSVQAEDQAGVEMTICQNSPSVNLIVGGNRVECDILTASIGCGVL